MLHLICENNYPKTSTMSVPFDVPNGLVLQHPSQDYQQRTSRNKDISCQLVRVRTKRMTFNRSQNSQVLLMHWSDYISSEGYTQPLVRNAKAPPNTCHRKRLQMPLNKTNNSPGCNLGGKREATGKKGCILSPDRTPNHTTTTPLYLSRQQ